MNIYDYIKKNGYACFSSLTRGTDKKFQLNIPRPPVKLILIQGGKQDGSEKSNEGAKNV